MDGKKYYEIAFGLKFQPISTHYDNDYNITYYKNLKIRLKTDMKIALELNQTIVSFY
jgi:hypothetical protein